MSLQHRLADRLHSVEWHGDYFSCECVFDSHEKPALLVYNDGYYCMSCAKGGSLEYLEQHVSNIPSRPTVHKHKLLPRWRNWETRYGDMEGIAKAAHQNVLKGNWMYFKHRKIDQFIEQGMFGLMDGWALFPVLDKNREVIDIVVRSIRQKGMKYVIRPYDGDEPRPLYVPNWERVNKADHIYIVYGIVTAWALESIHQPVVTGITGKSLNAELLHEFQKPITVIPDYNEEKDGAKLVHSLGWRGKLKLIDWPDYACEDLDDIRKNYGDEKLAELLGVNNEQNSDELHMVRAIANQSRAGNERSVEPTSIRFK